ncbi:MAG: helix-turn-helix transcriptional regulator, partial [Dehalococcoidia bacterium]
CHGLAGDTSARAAATQRANTLIQRLPGAAAPWDAAAPATKLLSGRQLEVAALAVEGLSSRDIAARLYVSVRTVDNHLYRIYAKLGVEGRQELAVALGRPAGSDGE